VADGAGECAATGTTVTETRGLGFAAARRDDKVTGARRAGGKQSGSGEHGNGQGRGTRTDHHKISLGTSNRIRR
jgi:hypothetical protein